MTDSREWHPYSKLFPLLGADALQSLADDIEANGLRQPIVIDSHERIIDGRNRHAACQLAGVKPVYEPFIGSDAEVLKLVISLNLQRRHLTDSQRAMVAAEIANIDDGRPKKTSSIEDVSPPITQQAAADMLHVSKTSVERATVVKKKGTDELRAAVVNGDVTVTKAAEIAVLPAAEQPAAIQEYVANPPRQKAHQSSHGKLASSYEDTKAFSEHPVEMTAKQEQGWGSLSEEVCRRVRDYARRCPAAKAKITTDLRNLIRSL